MKLARFAAATGLAAALIGAGVAPATAQQHSAGSPHSYTCSNQGGGPDHTVNCSGLITVNNVLNGTTVNVGDINVLSGNQLGDLEVALTDVADTSVNLPVTVQLANLEVATVDTYLSKFGITVLPVDVKVCVGSVCV
ncbi:MULTISPECIES: preprotein translocase subunit TatB [Streptomyces]|uniref:preprotein translocase subunit TatB n=1 Tax=Streptomyces TaxID=1883 RepID=UPI001E4EEF0C|nr:MULTISPECIES: preprotein translocase subunit TatB [Streptomyces]UFQ19961.1 preprotein translocase subunit TatB [Streptomyces huasconensis]WCL89582.1 preprotein translocase subunit TatB [Streptomyces sp. JCM 35825]